MASGKAALDLMKVIFCTPTRARPTDAYLESLKASVPLLDAAGIEHQALFETGCTYISWARAVLARRAFLEGNADAIVFLDDDVSWEPKALVDLIQTEGDVVAGTYRFKIDDERYMGTLTDSPDRRPVVRADGCIEGWFVPAGFMKLTRRVFDRMSDIYPGLKFGAAGSIDLFQHGAYNGLWYGEDFAFSRRWREAGGEIWIKPDLNLTHNDRNGETFPGNFHRFLLRQPGGSEYQEHTARVSIVIPCFNYAHYLADAIESALDQSHGNVEVIVVDDGSSDDTAGITDLYLDRGVIYIRRENGGCGAARNTGIAAATGEYIVCLDADDKLDPDYVRRCLNLVDRADIVGTSVREFGEREGCIHVKPSPSLTDFKYANQINCSSMFAKRVWEEVGGWNESRRLIGYEDWEFWLRAVRHGFKVKTINEPIFMYRKHGRSMIDDTIARHDELAALVREFAGV